MKTNSNNPYTYSSNGTSVYPITADYSNGTYVNRDLTSDYLSGTSIYPITSDYSNGTYVTRDNVMSGTCITSDSSNGTCGYPITSDYSSGTHVNGYYPYIYTYISCIFIFDEKVQSHRTYFNTKKPSSLVFC